LTASSAVGSVAATSGLVSGSSAAATAKRIVAHPVSTLEAVGYRRGVSLLRSAFAIASALVALGCGPEPEPAFPRVPYGFPTTPDDTTRANNVGCSIPLGAQRISVDAALKRYKVPGVSVAAMAGGQVVWARAWGFADAARTRPMTSETVLQAASVSKPMTAVAIMRMAQFGELSLDEDVSEYIDGWEAKRGKQHVRVTLRDLLSHSAGMSVHGFRGYDRGKQELPSTLDILNGKGNSGKVKVELTPRAQIKYSGGGFIVAQAAVEGEVLAPFSAAMHEWLIKPFGLTHSTYEQPIAPVHAGFAASGVAKGGEPVPGGSHVYPEAAAAGLWTTPTDLLAVAAGLLRAYQGAPAPISQAMVRQMLTPVRQGERAGIGWFMNATTDGVTEVQHSGLNEGFTSMIVWRTDGMGAAVMVNGEAPLVHALIEAIGQEYGWRPGRPADAGCQ
jgi:CubicO group peptidase (beta-lactamase class C family)